MRIRQLKFRDQMQQASNLSLPTKISARQPAIAVSPKGSIADTLPKIAGNLAVQRLFSAGAIQAKLSISQPHDAAEQEADRAADAIVSSSSSAVVQRKCSACGSGATCPKCQDSRVQPKEKSGHTPQMNSKAASQITSLLGGGQPLSSSIRTFFEPRLRQDLSQVRVHTDSQAAESASGINARAYTSGQDIVFDAGEYAPESGEGQRLLAHELAHVTQQQSDAFPSIQRQPHEKKVDWRPGMRARVVKIVYEGRHVRFWEGETVEVLSTPRPQVGTSYYLVDVQLLDRTSPRSGPHPVDVDYVEPMYGPFEASPVPAEQSQVHFQVNMLSEAAFAKATGIDPSNLPEDALIPLGQALATSRINDDQWLYGAAPGAGFGMTRAPWPAFPVPAYSTGVQWTQSAFGHFSQFSNVPGEPVIGGYRSWGVIHGYQGLHSTITGKPWTTPVPGRYFNDWWFRLMSPQSQTLVYREGTPQHADLVSRLIEQGQYTEPYTFPPALEGTRCANCITVPKTQMYGALGGKPVIVTEAGVHDISELGRPTPSEPFTIEQAGRGTTMREWLTKPTVQTPSGEIETLQVTRVPSSTVWGARGVTCIRAGGWILLIYGVYKTTERLEEAADTPYFNRVVAQEAGSWVGGVIGSAIGAAVAGAILCSPTGPVTLLCAAGGFVGGLVVGSLGAMAGAMGGDYVAQQLEGTLTTANEVFSPMIERSIWGDKPLPEIGYYPPRQYMDNPFEYKEERERYLRSQGQR